MTEWVIINLSCSNEKTRIATIMSILLSTSSVLLSKQFPTGPTIQDVLNVLHDPQQSLQLSEYVLSVIPDATRGENNFLVTKTIPLFGGYINGSSTYKVKWANVPEGVDIEVDAGLGTTVYNESRVRDDNGIVVFTESVTIQVCRCTQSP